MPTASRAFGDLMSLVGWCAPTLLIGHKGYPWFWNETSFIGDRLNDVHLTNAVKMESRKAKGAKS